MRQGMKETAANEAEGNLKGNERDGEMRGKGRTEGTELPYSACLLNSSLVELRRRPDIK